MMRLSPVDIYNKTFKKGFSFKAYDKEEVDDFMEQVGRDYETVFREAQLLKEENRELKSELKRYRNNEEKLRQALIAAQDAFSEKREQAEKEAESIIKDASKKAEAALEEYKRKLNERFSRYKRLQEMEDLFKLRLRNMLESQLEYLDKLEQETTEEANMQAAEFEEQLLEAGVDKEEIKEEPMHKKKDTDA